MDLLGLLFIAVPLILIFMVFNRQRRQQRDMMAAQTALAPGVRVMTTSGVYATVVSAEPEGDENTVVLEVAPGVRTVWARQAIGRIIQPVTEPTTDSTDSTDPREPGTDTGTA